MMLLWKRTGEWRQITYTPNGGDQQRMTMHTQPTSWAVGRDAKELRATVEQRWRTLIFMFREFRSRSIKACHSAEIIQFYLPDQAGGDQEWGCRKQNTAGGLKTSPGSTFLPVILLSNCCLKLQLSAKLRVQSRLCLGSSYGNLKPSCLVNLPGESLLDTTTSSVQWSFSSPATRLSPNTPWRI